MRERLADFDSCAQAVATFIACVAVGLGTCPAVAGECEPYIADLPDRFVYAVAEACPSGSLPASRLAEAIDAGRLVSIRGARIEGPIQLAVSHVKRSILLEHVEVKGDLVLIGTQVDKVILIVDSIIDGDVNVARAMLRGGLEIERTVIAGELNLFKAYATEPVSIVGSLVEGDFNAEHFAATRSLTIVQSDLGAATILQSASIEGGLDLIASTFRRDARFGRIHANSGIVAVGSCFGGNVSFNSARVGGSLLLRDSTVVGAADFIRSTIDGNLELTKASLRGSVDIGLARIRGDLSLDDIRARKTIDLRNASINDNLSASDAAIGGSIDATGVRIGASFVCRRSRITGTLGLNGIRIRNSALLAQTMVQGKIDAQFARIGSSVELTGVTAGGPAHFEGSELGMFMCGPERKAATRFKSSLSLSGASVRGGVLCRRVVIDGEATFDDFRAGATLKFSNARFNGPVTFRSASIDGSLLFSDPSCWETPRRCTSRFGDTATFDSMTVKGALECSGCGFERALSLANVSVGSYAALNQARLSWWADMHGLKTGRYLTLAGAVAQQDVNLWDIDLGSSLLLTKLTVNGSIYLRDGEVGGAVDCSETRFGGDVDLIRLRVGGSVLCWRARARKTVDFRSAVVSRNLDFREFRGADLRLDRTTISGSAPFNDARIGTASLIGTHIEGELSMCGEPHKPVCVKQIHLAGSSYGRLSTTWFVLRERLADLHNVSVLTQVEKGLTASGDIEGATNAYRTRRSAIGDGLDWYAQSAAWIRDRVQRHLLGYGFDVSGLLGYCGICVFFGAIMLSRGGAVVPKNEAAWPGSQRTRYLDKRGRWKLPLSTALWFSISVFLPGVSLATEHWWEVSPPRAWVGNLLQIMAFVAVVVIGMTVIPEFVGR